jgi:hypothetical protein
MLNREVGFALNNGHRQPRLAGPKSAINRCEQSQHIGLRAAAASTQVPPVLVGGVSPLN